MTKDKFAQVMYHKKISDLTEREKEQLEEDWKNYQNTAGKQNAYRAYDVYLRLSEIAKGPLEATIPALASMVNDSIHGEKTNLDKYLDVIAEGREVIKQIRELQEKEDKTDEDVKKIEDLTIKANELIAKERDLEQHTMNLLRGDVEGESVDFAD